MKRYRSIVLATIIALSIASCGTGDNKQNNMDIPGDTTVNTGDVSPMSTDTMKHEPAATPPSPDTNSVNRMNGTSTSNGVAPREGNGR